MTAEGQVRLQAQCLWEICESGISNLQRSIKLIIELHCVIVQLSLNPLLVASLGVSEQKHAFFGSNCHICTTCAAHVAEGAENFRCLYWLWQLEDGKQNTCLWLQGVFITKEAGRTCRNSYDCEADQICATRHPGSPNFCHPIALCHTTS